MPPATPNSTPGLIPENPVDPVDPKTNSSASNTATIHGSTGNQPIARWASYITPLITSSSVPPSSRSRRAVFIDLTGRNSEDPRKPFLPDANDIPYEVIVESMGLCLGEPRVQFPLDVDELAMVPQ